jgi:hypothetical protein
VPFAAPMIGEVPRAVLDHPYSYSAELTCAPIRHSGLTLVSGGLNRRPIRGAKRYICQLHDYLIQC